MRNLLLNIFLLVVFWGSFFSPVAAQPLTGEIVDIFGSNITTIQVEGGHPFSVGDTVDLTYMAGTLPMMIGQYEVTTIANDIFLGKPISQNVPPSNGMKVEIVLVQNATTASVVKDIESTIKIEPIKQNPSGSSQLQADAQKSSNVEQDKEIEGKVIAVIGEEIKVAVSPGMMPKAGWFVDLLYVTGQGKELPVGTWQVQSLEGQTVTATKLKGVGNAKKGLKAVMHLNQDQKPVENLFIPEPQSVGTKATSPEIQSRSKNSSSKTPQKYIARGKRYYEEKNYKLAFKDYEKAANMEDADAQRLLGDMYRGGKGVAQDYKKAREWYKRSAEKNNLGGIFNLGLLYAQGLGGPKDMAKTNALFLKAANKGYSRAQYNLGIFYKKGQGVDVDHYKSFKWLEMAAEQNHPRAMFAVGYGYEHGLGIEKDMAKALEYYRKAAKLGEKRASGRFKLLKSTLPEKMFEQ